LAARADDPKLAARIKTFETAFGMQLAVPDAFDFRKESDATLKLYGLERDNTKGFAWQCLAARRLIERGVRFVELIDTGSSGNWDSHGDMMDHARLARNVDQATAALLQDLRSRGLLEDTLVVWTTEFGRTPFNNTAEAKGREHHNWAFSSWLAGAGVKPGIIYGETDEYGMRVARNGVHVHDFHATILHLMGFDHERLTYRHSGRDFRLTDVAGQVVNGVLA
jgi:membrane-anchored protein YejM (alkaline phosphatase superfamily)